MHKAVYSCIEPPLLIHKMAFSTPQIPCLTRRDKSMENKQNSSSLEDYAVKLYHLSIYTKGYLV